MPSYFPRQTTEFRLEEPKAFRRFSFSLIEMALVTGVLLRIYRLLALTHGSNSWIYIIAAIAVAVIFVLGMETAHLANYPLHQYMWRAPAFAALEVAAEMATSALLIWLGREANGTVRAHWDDWASMGLHALLYRGLAIIVWGLILAGVISLVHRAGVHEDEDPEEVTTP
jgi:hypothetical protein